MIGRNGWSIWSSKDTEEDSMKLEKFEIEKRKKQERLKMSDYPTNKMRGRERTRLNLSDYPTGKCRKEKKRKELTCRTTRQIFQERREGKERRRKRKRKREGNTFMVLMMMTMASCFCH